jgi:hypothetical protein
MILIIPGGLRKPALPNLFFRDHINKLTIWGVLGEYEGVYGLLFWFLVLLTESLFTILKSLPGRTINYKP